jgi:hypothetical protein
VDGRERRTAVLIAPTECLREDAGVFDLDEFVDMVLRASPSWRNAGAVWKLDRSPDDGRNKHSVWVTVEHVDRAGTLIVWDSGEAELEAGGATMQMVQKHFDGLQAADDALDELVAIVVRSE